MIVRLAIIVLVAACDQGVKKEPPKPPAPKDAAAPDALVVVPRPIADCPHNDLVPSQSDALLAMLKRTSCYGPCPVYQVAVYLDGRVEYVGSRYVADCQGTAQLDAKQLAELTKMFEDKHFFALNGSYNDYDATDASSAEITFQPTPWRKKRIEHYHGDMDAPPVLEEIENEFDRIVGTARWTTIISPY
ncbi:MAG TPA: DUF6438 domain-containing protein [Kofleriaceae bacterium]|nr:DUF6438 domain-containing protein [Kofleriaceae bacterium]